MAQSQILPILAAVTLLQISPILAISHGLNVTFSDGTFQSYGTNQPNTDLSNTTEICNTGVWALYENAFYEYTSDVSVRILPEFSECQESWYFGTVKSARIIGAEGINNVPSVTVFSETDLCGNASVADEKGITKLQHPINSFVAIITEFAEFFREPNYEGDSFCVEMWYGSLEVDWYWNWDGIPVPWNPVNAKSVKLGCSNTENVVRAKTWGQKAPNNA